MNTTLPALVATIALASSIEFGVAAKSGSAASATCGSAEKADLSPEALAKTATHIVIGQVEEIWTRVDDKGPWKTTRYVAEIRVEKVDKGEGLVTGGLVYTRYWTRRWDGNGTPPPDTNGHRGLPAAGERVRVYLAQDAYDGFDTKKDGGFNVIGANGFAKP